MSKQRCVLCGRDPAAGFAKVGDDRYCHGDDDPEPTCYMQAQWGGWTQYTFRDDEASAASREPA